jgi:predicted ATPase
MKMNIFENDAYLRSIYLKRDKITSFDSYPFCLPVTKNLSTLEFHPKVTFLVGENGTGKSTFLEAIAVAYGLNPEGGSKNIHFSSHDTHSQLCDFLRVVKGIRMAKDSFFLRAESFYNLATTIDILDRDPCSGGKIIESYGNISLHEQSHGESFFAVFMNRLRGNGVYILDEPEAALSPSRQMSMLSRMHELVNQQSQFIIATHSPIIMAYPDAYIYEITNNGTVNKVNYKETEHYRVMKQFLNNTDRMLDILLQ